MTPHDRLTATIKNRLRRLQDWEVADVVKDIEEAGLLAGEWVSVKDGKPKVGKLYLVCEMGADEPEPFIAFWMGKARGNCWAFQEHTFSPTHYSEFPVLPQSPKADTGEKE